MDARRSSHSVERNRNAILAGLRARLPIAGRVLEIASGSGEHAAHFATALPNFEFQPSDPNPEARASIDAWCNSLPNVRPALDLDAALPDWPALQADAVVCINMIHIAPWAAAQGLVAGAGRVLRTGGLLVLYGPFLRDDVPTAPSNAAFDAGLRARDPAWGLRRLEDVTALAAMAGFGPQAITAMPANNLLVTFTTSER